MIPCPPPPRRKKKVGIDDPKLMEHAHSAIINGMVRFAPGADRFFIIADYIAKLSPIDEDIRLSARRFMAACRQSGITEITAKIAEDIYNRYPQLRERL